MTQGPSLEDLYDALDNEAPLDVDSPVDRKLYVPQLHATGGINPVDELLFQVRRSKPAGTWFFTGHRGVGKSTELRRVAHELREAGHVSVVADMGEYLNLAEEISIELLLLTMMAALASEAERFLGDNALERGFIGRLKDYLTRTSVDVTEIGAALDAPGVKVNVKALFKDNPTLRERVVKAVKGSLGEFATEVRGFAADIVQQIQISKPQAKVVLILDSLERLRFGGVGADKRYDAIQQTFETYAEYLKFDTLSVIYSIPPYLPHLVPKLGTYFGVGICTLPHVKVFERPVPDRPKDEPCALGVANMLESLTRRYPRAAEVIDLALLERLVLASSGSVREFFRLVKTAATKAILGKASLPLTDERWVRAAEQELRNEMPLAEEDVLWLKKVRVKHGTGLDKIEHLPSLARLFDSGLILGYRNGADWCDVHYLLRAEIDAAPVTA